MVNTINTNLKHTIQYAIIQSFYWSVFCSSYSFATVFLLARQFTNSQIGIVLGVAGLSSAFLQPAVAAFVDKAGKISIEETIVILIGMAAALASTRFFFSDSFMTLVLLFIFELSILYTLQPLVNTLGMRFINQGIEINFGLARGVGSMAYAIVSVILGALTQNFGAGSLPLISVGLYIVLGITVYIFMQRPAANSEGDALHPKSAIPENAGHGAASGLIPFLTRYKRFFVFLIAVVFTFCSHSMINNYLIQITKNVGGTAKEMGIANAISAILELPAMILFGFLFKKIRCSFILKFALFFFIIKAAVTLWAANVWALYAAQLLQFPSYALFIPASIFYVNEVIDRDDSTKGQAFMTSAITLGGVAASSLGGWLLDQSGTGGMLLVGLICAALGAVIGILASGKAKAKEYAADKLYSQD